MQFFFKNKAFSQKAVKVLTAELKSDIIQAKYNGLSQKGGILNENCANYIINRILRSWKNNSYKSYFK